MNLVKLPIYTEITGGYQYFYDTDEPIELSVFSYEGSRMGGSSISATLKFPVCLDGYWTGREFVIFRNVRYYLEGTPSSSKDNADERYVHKLEFLSEDDYILNHIFFYDGVNDEDHSHDEKWHSNSTVVRFFGTLDEFVGRFNYVLAYRGLDAYEIVIDDDSENTTEGKFVTFEGKTLFEALQIAYETWEVPFYRIGSEIHFGFGGDEVLDVECEYGPTKELLSIAKENARNKVVTRILGSGSEENIPNYYPNTTEKGVIRALLNGRESGISVTNAQRFAKNFGLADTLVYGGGGGISTEWEGDSEVRTLTSGMRAPVSFTIPFTKSANGTLHLDFSYSVEAQESGESSAEQKAIEGLSFEVKEVLIGGNKVNFSLIDGGGFDGYVNGKLTHVYVRTGVDIPVYVSGTGSMNAVVKGELVELYPDIRQNDGMSMDPVHFDCEVAVTATGSASGDSWGWADRDGGVSDLSEVGLHMTGTPSEGDEITQDTVSYITPSKCLMPPIFRSSGGTTMYYDALNNTYTKSGGGYYTFVNTYNARAPREHMEKFEDIKPTIEGVTYGGRAINVIDDVYYETGYNPDAADASGNREYTAFYVRLRPLGFSLIDSASTLGDMTLSMTSGQCGACNFKILVNDNGKNTVQVDGNGDLVLRDNGRVVEGAPQEAQNDTTDNWVWLKLAVDTSTYGGEKVKFGIMPSYNEATGRGQKVESGDTFVILNIDLPTSYITAAEDRLKTAMLDFMEENNAEKFNFPIKFSRISLAENPDLRDDINEHCMIQLKYNGQSLERPLYVNSFTYKQEEGQALPDISVELLDSISVNPSVLDEKIDEQVGGLTEGFYGRLEDLLAKMHIEDRYLSKIQEDTAAERLHFTKGFDVGEYLKGIGGTGAAILIDSKGQSHADVDFLNVRKKAVFTEIEIDKLKSVGGKILVSLANMTCSMVEEVTGGYKCYFDREDGEGKTIDQCFEVGDLAMCQSFNVSATQYYWRKVVGVGEDYIILSDVEGEFDPDSTIPAIGDEIVQFGNVSDASRQNAQIISAYGDDAPSHMMYSGIGAECRFELTNKDVYGVVYTDSGHVDEEGNPIYVQKIYDYGDVYFGARSGSSYMKWDSVAQKLFIRGTISQSPSGEEFPVPCPRGTFVSGTTSAFYGDLFDYNGDMWLCIDPLAISSATAVTTNPVEGTKWHKYTSGGEGAKLIAIIASSLYFGYDNPTDRNLVTTSPITLTADVQNVNGYKWQYMNSSNAWVDTGSTSSSMTVAHTSDRFTQDNGRSARFRLVCTDTGYTSLHDTVTITKMYGGVNGEGGITVFLGNSAKIFEADTDHAIDNQTDTFKVFAFKGLTPLVPSIGTITGQITGKITASASGDTVTVRVTSALTAASGNLIIPVTVEGQTINLTYSWSLSFVGAPGQDGQPGRDGQDGRNVTTITLYKRATSTPSVPYSNLTYKFSDNSLTGTLEQWTRDIPEGVNPCYSTQVHISTTDDTFIINRSMWSTVTKILENGRDGTSAYYLDLSNENMGVNADSSGNILAGGHRPSCEAQLYLGSAKVTQDVTYSLGTLPAGASGISLTQSQGKATVVLSSSGLAFSGDSIEVTVNAYVSGSGTAVASKKFNLAKNMAGVNGADGVDGQNGQDGTSIIFKGSFSSAPTNPENGWSYYNTTTKKSYVYQSGTWYQMTVDGVDGANGENGHDGLSIVWKGESATPPSNPQTNWCYRDTDNGIVYLYNGTAWQMMTHDGSDGEDGTNGTNGSDGLSVFITYHDNAVDSTPSTPTGSGTSGGWHTNPTSASNWMSQKVAATASSGTWGTPIRIGGKDGQNGNPGADAVTYEVWVSANQISASKINNQYVPVPSQITAKEFKSVGAGAPGESTDLLIRYCYINRSTGQRTSTQPYSTRIQITASDVADYSHIVVGLYTQSGTTYTLYGGEEESIPILINGEDGAPGGQGEPGATGPTVRGPVYFNDAIKDGPRNFYNGTGTGESSKWIDIVVHYDSVEGKDKIYKANSNLYNVSSWNASNWTEANEFNFVATDVLYAENAVIERAVIRKLETKPQDEGQRIVAIDDYLIMTGADKQERLRVTGEDVSLALPNSFQRYEETDIVEGEYTSSRTQFAYVYRTLASIVVNEDNISQNPVRIVVRPIGIRYELEGTNSNNILYANATVTLRRGSEDVQTLSTIENSPRVDPDEKYDETLSYSGSIISINVNGTYSIYLTMAYRYTVVSGSSIKFKLTTASGSMTLLRNNIRIVKIGANGMSVSNGENFSSSFGEVDNTQMICFQGVSSNNEVIGLMINPTGVWVSQGNKWELVGSGGGGQGGSSVSWLPAEIVGPTVPIGTLSINGTPNTILAPSGGGGGTTVSWSGESTYAATLNVGSATGKKLPVLSSGGELNVSATSHNALMVRKSYDANSRHVYFRLMLENSANSGSYSDVMVFEGCADDQPYKWTMLANASTGSPYSGYGIGMTGGVSGSTPTGGELVYMKNYNYYKILHEANLSTFGIMKMKIGEAWGTNECYIQGSSSDAIIYLNAGTNGNGSVIANCAIYDSSDARLKDIIKDIDFSLEDLRSIPKVLFTWKKDESRKVHLGTVAQGIKDKFPFLVTQDENGYYSVNYDALGVLALQGIDKLADENEELRRKNQELEERLRRIEEKLGL